MKPSDFRSDTVTGPTAAMREAMAEAEVGDDVLDGDPTVERLQEAAADWLGKERALYVPSGTMANQIAAGTWCEPGDEVILEARAHMLLYEAGALGAIHGLQTVPLFAETGALDAEAVRAAIRPDFIHCPRTGLVAVEQTHMASGGRVVALESLEAVAAVAREAGLPVHMDGARLPHAVAASGLAAPRWTASCDSVSMCLSKGLGAPVGSVVAGSAGFIERAMLWRKRLGGWMRQAGGIAAAGLIALEEGSRRLGEDHALAQELARTLSAFEGLSARPEEVETNLVLVRVARPGTDAGSLVNALEAEGVRVLALSPDTLRFVTHRDVGSEDVARLKAALEAILSAA